MRRTTGGGLVVLMQLMSLSVCNETTDGATSEEWTTVDSLIKLLLKNPVPVLFPESRLALLLLKEFKKSDEHELEDNDD